MSKDFVAIFTSSSIRENLDWFLESRFPQRCTYQQALDNFDLSLQIDLMKLVSSDWSSSSCIMVAATLTTDIYDLHP
jgi:hypothetical protein